MPKTSHCSGSVTLWSTSKDFPGPEVLQPIEFEARFNDTGTGWTADNFKPVQVKDIDGGLLGKLTLTVTLTQAATGSLDRTSGAITLDARFKFKFDSILVGPSTLTLPLDTRTEHGWDGQPPVKVRGQPLGAASGVFALAGTGTFANGKLNGVKCAARLEAKFNPVP